MSWPSPPLSSSAEPSSRMPPAPCSPGGLLVRAVLFLLAAWFCVPWVMAVADPAALGPSPAAGMVAALRQLHGLEPRLTADAARAMNQLFPEGELFTYSFYGYAIVNLHLMGNEAERRELQAAPKLARLIARIEGLRGAPPFAENATLTPEGGIIFAGQLNLLRAGYLLAGGEAATIRERFRTASSELAHAFVDAPVPALESYPGLVWPVDSICALASLAHYERLIGGGLPPAVEAWQRWTTASLDARTGMPPAQITGAGLQVEVPRGCALSWMLAFAPDFAPELSRRLYDRFRREWWSDYGLVAGFREWPVGYAAGGMDSDTGPIIGGIGAAATGFGLAASRVNGDSRTHRRILRQIELFGLPAHDTSGHKTYFFGAVLLPEILILWGRTVTPWVAAIADPLAPTSTHLAGGGDGGLQVGVAVTASVVLLLGCAWSAVSCLRRLAGARQWPTGFGYGVLAGHVVVIAAWLGFGWLRWFEAMAPMLLLECVEARLAAHRCRAAPDAAGRGQLA